MLLNTSLSTTVNNLKQWVWIFRLFHKTRMSPNEKSIDFEILVLIQKKKSKRFSSLPYTFPVSMPVMSSLPYTFPVSMPLMTSCLLVIPRLLWLGDAMQHVTALSQAVPPAVLSWLGLPWRLSSWASLFTPSVVELCVCLVSCLLTIFTRGLHPCLA